MVLTYEQIRQLATGAVDHVVTDLGLCLYHLHPNDAGYEHYFNNLWAGMRPMLEG